MTIEAALRGRIARTSDRAALRRASLVFDAGYGGAWTVELRRGEATLSKGRARGADATIFSDASTMKSVLEGRLAGVQAFLDGRRIGGGSFDAIAGSLNGLFDFTRVPNVSPLVLDPRTGAPVK